MQQQETTPALGPKERLGVDTIPEPERIYTPWSFAALFLGGSFAPGSLAWGWLPITLGLGVVDAITSIVVGVGVGVVVIAPLVVLGTRTATNNATSSGAFFGVRGRLIGSFLGLLLMLVTAALAVWTAGGMLVSVLARLFGTPTGNGTLGVAYLLLTVLSVVIAVWGYHLLVRLNIAIAIVGVGFAVLLVVAFASKVDPGYAGGQYALGSLGRTWLLSALAFGVGGVMLIATQVGDWSRYVPAERYPTGRMLRVALPAIAAGFIIPPALGALVTSAFVDPYAPWPQSVVDGAPGWFTVALLVMASVGNLGFSAPVVYSTGLDLDAIVARLSRARATWITGAAAVVLVMTGVLVGSVVWDANQSLTAAALILLALTGPWAAIVGIGHLRCRGRYDLADLQVFNRRQRGGRYWFWHGWSWRAVLAWAVGAAVGLTTVTSTLYTGVFASVAGGVDVSFVASFLVAGVLYLVLETVPLFGARPALAPVAVPDHDR
jgi:purine-cytosine permease-like protein